MKKLLPILCVVSGLAALILTGFLGAQVKQIAAMPSAGIIGGADGPTFRFILSQSPILQATAAAWIVFLVTLTVLIVGRIRKKR